MKYFIDHSMDKAMLLLDKTTGVECGKILAYYTDSPNGAVCHAKVILWDHGYEVLGLTGRPTLPDNASPDFDEGRAGGGSYDKFSAAVSSALRKMGLGGGYEHIGSGVFSNTMSDAMRAELADKIKAAHIIPVYSGAGNVVQAFKLYFRVIEVL